MLDMVTFPLHFRHSLLTLSQEREASFHSILVNSFTVLNSAGLDAAEYEEEETVSHVYFSLNSSYTR